MHENLDSPGRRWTSKLRYIYWILAFHHNQSGAALGSRNPYVLEILRKGNVCFCWCAVVLWCLFCSRCYLRWFWCTVFNKGIGIFGLSIVNGVCSELQVVARWVECFIMCCSCFSSFLFFRSLVLKDALKRVTWFWLPFTAVVWIMGSVFAKSWTTGSSSVVPGSVSAIVRLYPSLHSLHIPTAIMMRF